MIRNRRVALLFVFLPVTAACSGRDIQVGGTNDVELQTCPVTVAPRASMCDLPISGTPDERQQALTALQSMMQLWGEVDDLVTSVDTACVEADIDLGVAPAPSADRLEDARTACATLRQLLVERGPFRVTTQGDPPCHDLARPSCPNVALPAQRVCDPPSIHVDGPSSDDVIALTKVLPVLFATKAELDSMGSLVGTVSANVAHVDNAPSACLPPTIQASTTTSSDASAIAQLVSEVVSALE
jgi:hypothetical protein